MPKIKLLVYSPSGRGKTYLAKTGLNDPNIMPMLLVDFEGGTDSIASCIRQVGLKEDKERNIFKLGKDVKNDVIDVWRVKSWKDFDDVYDYLSEAENVYKTVVLDSLSELNKFNLFEQTGAYNSAKRSIMSIVPPKIQDYGRSNAQIEFLVRYFRDLDMNVIFTAGCKLDEQNPTGGKKYYPNLTGQLAGSIPHIVSIVAYYAMRIEENNTMTRVLAYGSSEVYEAKIRDEFGLCGDHMDNPTLTKLYNLLNGETN